MFNIFSSKKNNQKYQINTKDHQDLAERWLDDSVTDGKLMLDVYQNEKQIIVKASMAGVKPEDLKISINNDLLTIKGKRDEETEIKEADYVYKECYWGSFSRSIVLPSEVDNKKIKAFLENGVVSIFLEKVRGNKDIKVIIKE